MPLPTRSFHGGAAVFTPTYAPSLMRTAAFSWTLKLLLRRARLGTDKIPAFLHLAWLLAISLNSKRRTLNGYFISRYLLASKDLIVRENENCVIGYYYRWSILNLLRARFQLLGLFKCSRNPSRSDTHHPSFQRLLAGIYCSIPVPGIPLVEIEEWLSWGFPIDLAALYPDIFFCWIMVVTVDTFLIDGERLAFHRFEPGLINGSSEQLKCYPMHIGWLHSLLWCIILCGILISY